MSHPKAHSNDYSNQKYPKSKTIIKILIKLKTVIFCLQHSWWWRRQSCSMNISCQTVINKVAIIGKVDWNGSFQSKSKSLCTYVLLSILKFIQPQSVNIQCSMSEWNIFSLSSGGATLNLIYIYAQCIFVEYSRVPWLFCALPLWRSWVTHKTHSIIINYTGTN